jgi:hypothetical protein
MEGEFLLMDALVATFKPQNPNFLAGFVPKFQCQIQAQNSNLLFKGVLRGLPYANFPLKSTGKNIVSVQRRCSIIYSSLQLLQLLLARRKERRSRAVKRHQRHLPGRPKNARPPVQLPAARSHTGRHYDYLRTVRKF